MTCNSALLLIESCIDGELDAALSAELRRHLDECPSCAAAHRKINQLSGDLRSLAPRYTAPEGLRNRILENLRQANKPIAVPRQLARNTWAIAATVLLAISIGWNLTLRQSMSDNAVAQELVSSHIRSMIGDHLLDVPSTDRHNVKPWFNGKLDYSPDVRDFAAQGFALIGGRVDYLDHRPVAALVYKRRQHTINLFVWPSGSSISAPHTISGFNLVAWNKAGMEYCAVSDLNQDELRQFEELYRQ
jgi:anti-sigma factor RsiW